MVCLYAKFMTFQKVFAVMYVCAGLLVLRTIVCYTLHGCIKASIGDKLSLTHYMAVLRRQEETNMTTSDEALLI